MINLPFKLELNAPISKVIKSPQQSVKYDKQLFFALNRLFKHKLRNAFISIKTSQLWSPLSYFKFVLASVKQTKRQNRILYPTYSPQLPPSQPQVPKTPIFNHRVKSIKNQAFLKLKQFTLEKKSSQVSTLVKNRQNELLNHFIPKIEQRIYAIIFKAIGDYAREKKGRSKIVRLMDKLGKNIVNRVYFSEFMNKLKAMSQKESRKKLSCQKFMKILSLSQRYILQQGWRKIQSYQQLLKLQASQLQKKERIARIHLINSQRTVTIQKQRQALRNLKYKLDQQSIQKNHILTQKRRSLMLSKTKFTQQSKQLTQHSLLTSCQIHLFSTLFNKQSHIFNTLQQTKSLITQLSHQGIDFQRVTLTVYKAIYDAEQEGLEGFREIVKHHEKKWDHVDGMVGWQGVNKKREWMGRKIGLLERIVRGFQKRQGQSKMNESRFKPLGSTDSASQLKFSPSISSLKSSRIITSQYKPKSRIHPDPSQLARLKQQYQSLQSFISLILSKSYQLKINQAITAEIDQLSELLASDLKENEEE